MSDNLGVTSEETQAFDANPMRIVIRAVSTPDSEKCDFGESAPIQALPLSAGGDFGRAVCNKAQE